MLVLVEMVLHGSSAVFKVSRISDVFKRFLICDIKYLLYLKLVGT